MRNTYFKSGLIKSLLTHTLLIVLVSGVFNSPKGGSNPNDGALGSDTPKQILPKSNESIDVTTIEEKSPMAKKEKPAPNQNKSCKSFYGGIGVTIGIMGDGTTMITNISPGYPAELSGLKVKDVIVDPVITYGSDGIKGEVGSKVTITIYRPSTDELFTLTMVRDKICVGDK